jgi:hypothetical protein
MPSWIIMGGFGVGKRSFLRIHNRKEITEWLFVKLQANANSLVFISRISALFSFSV